MPGEGERQRPRPLLRRVWSGTKRLWDRAKREHSTPREVGWSVGVGVFSGCTPFIGFHLGIAFVLATLFRLNRLWSMVGSRVSMTLFLAPIVFVEIEGAHRVRTGRWAPGALEDIWAQRRELATDWLLGSGVVGPVLAAILGFLAYRAALRWASARSPAGPLPPSSGSRPSAPPAPPA